MKNKIFFVFATPPLQIYKQRYCVEYFEIKGWETHIIDVSPILNPGAYRTVKSGLISKNERELFFSKKQYRNYIKKAGKGAIFILTMDFYLDSFFIHKDIQYNQAYGYLNRMDTNVEVIEEETSKKIGNLLKKFTIHRLCNAIFVRIPRKMFKIKPADFVILGGVANKEEYLRLCFIDNNTLIKHIHSLDYEKYLEIKDSKERIMKEPYCVFLDQFIPYHPDNISRGFNIDGERYYSEITSFFYMIQEYYHVKVVIAAHPRSEYGIKTGLFDKFQIMKFKTAELVRDAEFVIAHFSTSISFAVAFKKPIILITNNDINKIELFYKIMMKYSVELSAKIFNISTEINPLEMDIYSIKADKYFDFSNKYLKAMNTKDERFYIQMYELIQNINEVI